MLKTILGNTQITSSQSPVETLKAEKWKTTWLLLVMGLALVVFFPVLNLFFVTFDENIPNIASIMQSFTWDNFQKLYTVENNFTNYFHFKFISKEFSWYGLSPKGYHTISLFLHVINSGLAFYAIWLLTQRNILSIVATVLFAIHPTRSEAVAAILGQGELLMTFFALLSTISYLRYHNRHKEVVKASLNLNNNTKYLYLSLLFYVFAVLFKFTALPLPFVFILIDQTLGKLQGIKQWIEKIVFFLLMTVGLCVMISLQLESSSKDYFGVPNYNIFDRLILVIYTTGIYLKNLLVPYNLSPFYPYPTKTGFILHWSCYVISAITLGFGFIIWKLKNHVWVKFGILFFLVQIALFSNIFHLGGRTFANDENIYLASLGIFIAIAYTVDYVFTAKPKYYLLILGTFGAFTLAFVMLSYLNTKHYTNGITLWTHMVETNPRNYYVRMKRGEIRMLDENTYREGMMDLNIALEEMPDDADVWSAKGVMHLHIGDYIGADSLFTQALKRNPSHYMAYFHRAHTHKGYQRYDQALADYDKSIRFNPNYAPAYLNRGGVKQTIKDYQGALKDYDRAIKLNPSYGEAYLNRGNIYFLAQAYPMAVKDYDKALALLPQSNEVFFYRGLTRSQLGDKQGACMDLNVAKNLGKKEAEQAIKDICK